MKQAIISGSTGLLAIPLVRILHEKGIQAICLGSKTHSKDRIHEIFGFDAIYLPLLMENIKILPNHLSELGLSITNSCIFYNFAWRGSTNLTDGSFADQLKNAVCSAEAVKVAKNIGCIKYINIGSIQETLIENTSNNSTNDWNSMQTNYSLSKVASRDMCKITAYLEKIDYVHTRFSIPLDFSLKKGSYVSKTLKEIIVTGTFTPPSNKQLFDIISLEDSAEYLYLVGLIGKNKHDYYIGSGIPAKLEEFFWFFQHIVHGQNSSKLCLSVCDSPDQSYFDTSRIQNLTDRKPLLSFEELALSLRKS